MIEQHDIFQYQHMCTPVDLRKQGLLTQRDEMIVTCKKKKKTYKGLMFYN